MSTDRDTTRIVRSWLRADEHVSADRLLDDVLTAVDTTPQRPSSWPARRLQTMNNTVRLIATAAAVVVVALIGYQLFIGPNVSGPAPETSPSPVPSAAPSDESGVENEVRPGALDPGTYTASNFGDTDISIQFTVPDGWTWNTWYLSKSAGVSPPAGVGIGFMTGSAQEDFQVYTDPCHWEGAEPDPPTGPTAEDFIRALAAQPTRNATEPTELWGDSPEEADVWRGWTTTLIVPEDIDFSDCAGGQFRSWGPPPNERFHQGPGQRDLVWAVDYGSVYERLVIFAATFPGTPEDVSSEVDAILNSIVSYHTH